jgi:hypothetical protein
MVPYILVISFIQIPTRCTYLFIYQLYMFRAMPIFRSSKRTLQNIGVCTLWKTEF